MNKIEITPLINIINENNYKNATADQKKALAALTEISQYLSLNDIQDISKQFNSSNANNYFYKELIEKVLNKVKNKTLDKRVAEILFQNKTNFFNPEKFRNFDFAYNNRDLKDIINDGKILEKINLINNIESIIKSKDLNKLNKEFFQHFNKKKDLKKYLIKLCAINADDIVSKTLLNGFNIAPNEILSQLITKSNYNPVELKQFLQSDYLKNNLYINSSSKPTLNQLVSKQAFNVLYLLANKYNLGYVSSDKLKSFYLLKLKGNSGERNAFFDLYSKITDNDDKDIIKTIFELMKNDIFYSFSSKASNFDEFLIEQFKFTNLSKSANDNLTKELTLIEKNILNNSIANINSNSNKKTIHKL